MFFWPAMAFMGKVILATLTFTVMYGVLKVCIGAVLTDLCNVFFEREEDERDDG